MAKKTTLSKSDIRTLKNAADIIKKNGSDKKSITLASGLQSFGTMMMPGNAAPQINQTHTMNLNLRRTPLTFDRPTLNFLYMEYGIIRAAIDQPVDDALRGGLDIKSNELDADDIQRLHEYLEDHGVYAVWRKTMRWGRLFGGGGCIILNGQDPSTKLDIKSMNENSPLEFEDADRWELSMPNFNKEKRLEEIMYPSTPYFFYYTKAIHNSRVQTVRGDEAPSLIRRMLMGWGLSEVEKMVRDLNELIKAQNVIFELLDEAKIDVYRLEGYKAALVTPGGEERMAQSVGMTNSMKNFLQALILDKNDEFDQKQITFSGLSEMLKEIRIAMASAVRMPVTKLFGISAAGFSSGEDDIENYNAMVESDIRSRLRPMIRPCLDCVCMKLFGHVPAYTYDFKSLRIMDQNQEEDMKTKKQMRILANYDKGFISAKQAMEAQRAEGLLTTEKSLAEMDLTDDFPTPPIEKVTASIKPEEDQTDKEDNGQSFGEE